MVNTRMISNLKSARMRAKLSQEELARKVRVSRETIKNIEYGTNIPNVLLALDISKLVGVELSEIFKPLEQKQTLIGKKAAHIIMDECVLNEPTLESAVEASRVFSQGGFIIGD